MRPHAPIPILSYHQIGAALPRGTPGRGMVVSPQQFTRQMRALHRSGWRGLSLADLLPYLRHERRGKVLGITLDDGYASVHAHALPVLRALGFTATAFVVADQVGGCNAWDAPLGAPQARLMDLPQLRGWIDAGMEVGAHTCSHPDLSLLAPDLAREEVARCRADLTRALGVDVRSFSYPYGRYRDEHVDMVRTAGYELAVTCASRRVPAGADPLQLPRLTVWASTPLPLLIARVATGLEDWRDGLRSWRGQRRWPWLTGRPGRPSTAASAGPGAAAAVVQSAPIPAISAPGRRRSAPS